MEGKEMVELEVGLVESSPFQMRKEFPEEGLRELAASISKQGLLQPVLVRPRDRGYELIAGERRLRAARMAGLERIPAIVRRPSDLEARVESLMENLQREELNEMDRARGILALKETMGASWRQVAEVLGLTERRVMQLAQLTKLEEGVQAMIAEGVLPSRVGIVLAGLEEEEQREMAERARKEGWSSNELAQRIRRGRAVVSGQSLDRLGMVSKVEPWPVEREEGGYEETRFGEQGFESVKEVPPVRPGGRAGLDGDLREVRRREVYPSVLYRIVDPLLNFLETSLHFAREITAGDRKEVMERLERLDRALGRFKAELVVSSQ